MKRYLSATFASLSTRNYRLFFIGQSISQTGTWMQRMAQAWLVLELTDSGTWLGLTLAIQQLPSLLVTPWAGLLADRHRKRTILLWAAVGGAVPAALLGILTLTGHISAELVLGLALMVGLVDAIEKPTRQALPSELVKPAQLTNAVTLANVVNDSGKAVGPAIAGVLISLIGLPYTFLINAASFGAVVCGLLLMDPAQLQQPERVRRNPGQVRAGIRYVRSHPPLLGPLALLATAGLLAYNFQVLLPLLGRQAFAGDARAVGWLLGAMGLGAVIGGLALAGVITPTLPRVVGAALVLAAGLVLTGSAPSLGVALVLVFCLGTSSVVFKTLTSTWLQLTAEPTMRGRVLSLLVVAIAGTSPIGAPLIGSIANELGVRVAFVVAGVGTAIAAALTYRYLRLEIGRPWGRRRRREPDAPAHSAAQTT